MKEIKFGKMTLIARTIAEDYFFCDKDEAQLKCEAIYDPRPEVSGDRVWRAHVWGLNYLIRIFGTARGTTPEEALSKAVADLQARAEGEASSYTARLNSLSKLTADMKELELPCSQSKK